MGADLRAWWRLLRGGRFRIGWTRVPLVLWVTLHCAFCTVLGMIQRALLGRRIDATLLHDRPIFIIGHWRCGTTLLHQLLSLDDRHTAPNVWECFAPHIPALLGEWFPTWTCRIVPRVRPMDGLPFEWDEPQEDEFALCNLGQPSPYALFAFPSGRQTLAQFRASIELATEERRAWRDAWTRFLRQVCYRRPGRLVLKSPPHACRVDVLREVFPQALFVHIVREPERVFRSTENMWQMMCESQSIQAPGRDDVAEFVIETFNYMHERLDEALRAVPAENIVTVRYEELIADPIVVLRGIYERFALGGFEALQPKIAAYLSARRDRTAPSYRELAPHERRRIEQAWRGYATRYAYAAATDMGADAQPVAASM